MQGCYGNQMFRQPFAILGTSDTLHSWKVLIAKEENDYQTFITPFK